MNRGKRKKTDNKELTHHSMRKNHRLAPKDVALKWIQAGRDQTGFKIEVYPTKGRGIVTTIKRNAGDFLLQYCGEKISAEEGDRREEEKSTGYRFFYGAKEKKCIDASEETEKLGRLVNHGSKERNARMREVEGNLALFAIRDISPGEEILYDYGIKDLPWEKAKASPKEKPKALPDSPSKSALKSSLRDTKAKDDSSSTRSESPKSLSPAPSGTPPARGTPTIQGEEENRGLDETDSPYISFDESSKELSGHQPTVTFAEPEAISSPRHKPAEVKQASPEPKAKPETKASPAATEVKPKTDKEREMEEYKAKLTEERRLAREKAEREDEIERLRKEEEQRKEEERERLEEERQHAEEEEAMRIAEESRKAEEERLQKAIEAEERRKEEAERLEQERIAAKTSPKEKPKALPDSPSKSALKSSLRDTKAKDDSSSTRSESPKSLSPAPSGTPPARGTPTIQGLDETDSPDISFDESSKELSGHQPTVTFAEPEAISSPRHKPAEVKQASPEPKAKPETKASPAATEVKPKTDKEREMEEYKAKLTEERRLAREKAEREDEIERLRKEEEQRKEEERERLEEERQHAEEEEAMRIAEESRKAEEERLQKAIEAEERRKKEEAERLEQERIAVKMPQGGEIERRQDYDSVQQQTRGITDDFDRPNTLFWAKKLENFGLGADVELEFCPTCNLEYNSKKKRKVKDSCGHERCLSCMFINDECPVCIGEVIIESENNWSDLDDDDDDDDPNYIYLEDEEPTSEEIDYMEDSDQETISVIKDDDGNKQDKKSAEEDNQHKITVKKRGHIKQGCKQIYDKTNFCTFCKKAISSKITRHLFTHKNERIIRDIVILPKRSKKRINALEVLVNEGNFKHNVEVLKSGEGHLVVARRDQNDHEYSQYTPCVHCKKFLLKVSLWAHKKSCVANPPSQPDENDRKERNLVRQGKFMLSSALFEVNEESLGKLFARMRHDDITEVAMADSLIKRYASLRMDSLGQDEDQKLNDIHRVSQGTRTLARLIMEAKKLDDQQIVNMDCLIRPENFDLVVETALTMSLKKDNQVASLGQRIGHALSHVIAMKIGLALRGNNKTKQNEAESFEKLFQSEWNFRVNSSCTKRQNKINRNKVKTIPLTEDLKTIRHYITTKMAESLRELKENPKPEHWTSLAKYTMSRLILFNMRRQSEVKDLKVTDFLDRPNWALDQAGEFEMALSKADKLCAERMDMLVAAGKSRKNVDAYVLLPPDAKLAVEILIKYRGQVGVPETNPYIFARIMSNSPLSGNQELRNIADSCPGLQHANRIGSNCLRKYIATVSQILDMNEKEVEMLATHLGHDVKTHKENYRLAHSTRELTAVAQLLLTIERGDVNRWKGKKLCEIEIDDLEVPEYDQEMPNEDFHFQASTSLHNVVSKEKEIELPLADDPESSEGGMEDCLDQDAEPLSTEAGTCERGQKRRWDEGENEIFCKVFKEELQTKRMPPRIKLQKASDALPRRTIAQIRTRVNNVIKQKQIV